MTIAIETGKRFVRIRTDEVDFPVRQEKRIPMRTIAGSVSPAPARPTLLEATRNLNGNGKVARLEERPVERVPFAPANSTSLAARFKARTNFSR